MAYELTGLETNQLARRPVCSETGSPVVVPLTAPRELTAPRLHSLWLSAQQHVELGKCFLVVVGHENAMETYGL